MSACVLVAVLLSPLLVSVALAGLLCGALCVLVGLVGIALARQAARPAPAPADDALPGLPTPEPGQPAGPAWDLAHLMLSPDRPLCGGPGCWCQADDRDIYRRYGAIVAAERAREIDAARRAAERQWGGGDA